MTFTMRLERADGTPAEPPTIQSAVTNWRTGDTIPLGRERTLRTRLKNDKSHPLRWLSAFRDRKEGTSLLSAGWLGALGHAAKPSSPDLHGSAWSSRVARRLCVVERSQVVVVPDAVAVEWIERERGFVLPASESTTPAGCP
jgi:hypothetical protein